MGCQNEALVGKICELYDKISSLESLKPSEDVDMLFNRLVATCIPPSPIDVTKLCKKVQDMRSHLIKLCAEAESHLESHFSSILGSFSNPLENLAIFPYYSNYLKLSKLEYDILSHHVTPSSPVRKIAFVGSGPLPLTSIVLACFHLPDTVFHNYDIDPSANSLAVRLVSADPDLSSRMLFHTTDIMDVTTALKDYDVVFLAALVGMDREQKARVVDHLARHMASGAILMLRSAHGARGFLYPIVDSCDLKGFEVLSVYHPTDEVINSVVIARRQHHPAAIDQGLRCLIMPCNCSKMHGFGPLISHGNMIEELAIEEQSS